MEFKRIENIDLKNKINKLTVELIEAKKSLRSVKGICKYGTVKLTGVEKFSIFHSEKSLIFTCWSQYFIFVNYCFQ